MFRKLRTWAVMGIVLLFGLGALNRILNDPKGGELVGGILDSLASLFSKTING